jgi:hypothetical protein
LVSGNITLQVSTSISKPATKRFKTWISRFKCAATAQNLR